MTNLKPCPFCGSEAEIVDVCNDCFISGKVGIGCSKCPVIIAEYGEYKVFDNEAEAIEAWNNRTECTCHWVDVKNGVLCSNCGIGASEYIKHDGLVRYCPSCGAKVVQND